MHKRHFTILAGIILVVFAGLLFFGWRKINTKINFQDGRVNVLIMGKGGAGHAAPDLTDTMILTSVSLAKEKTVMISIPRDLWIPGIRAKINSAYYWGNFPLAKSTVQGVVGVPVNYALVLDFSAFKEIVDVLGGITLTVDSFFTDARFPIIGKEDDLCGGDLELKCRYETLHFQGGEQIMDGATALKFVRSRNGDNGENTDLAREARQQKVITAIKEKVLQPATFLNPARIIKLIKVVKASVETDLNFGDEVILGKKLLAGNGGIASYVFPEEFLTIAQKSPKYDYQYVFLPKSGSWEEIQKWFKEILIKN